MKDIRQILASYPIHVVSQEQITKNVLRIFDGQRAYALKRSQLTSEAVAQWENVYNQAYQQHISSILPVYMTNQGELSRSDSYSFYYLTPWISEKELGRKEQIKRLYHTIGDIHAKTQQSFTMDAEKITASFTSYRKTLQTNRKLLLECVELFEKSRYMSPVELLVCTHYRDLDSVMRELDQRVERFIDEVNGQSEWRSCLCHGQLDFSHCLFGEQTYITNWEHAYYDNATRDLAAMYHTIVTDYDDPVDDLLHSFTDYTKKNQLSNAELYLLSIYLLDPTDYMDRIGQYRNNPSETAQVDMVQQLQRAYRKLLFAGKWLEFSDSETETETADEAEN
ncbi:phosphotransferase [Lentibacillus sp. N15]|uniref:phosphotransferase n=1 Tax=Lentibacillus songyuanensis TaxID=3136161 RepID=UPI0031BB276E